MIKKIEVIGLPGQGKSTLVLSCLKNSQENKKYFSVVQIFRFLVYLFFWTKVLISGKSKHLSYKNYFKIIVKRGLDSFFYSKNIVDEGSLQNFLSFFEYFDSIDKIRKPLKTISLPSKVIVIQIKDEEKSLKMSSNRLENRRGLESDTAREVSLRMKKVLDSLVSVLKERGTEIFFLDSFENNSEDLFIKYLNEKNT